jgi:hypothetical protein
LTSDVSSDSRIRQGIDDFSGPHRKVEHPIIKILADQHARAVPHF